MNILLSGASGKVGQEIERVVNDNDALSIIDRATREAFLSEADNGDVLIDFSNPGTTDRVVEYALAHQLPLVMGTTGLDEHQQHRINDASRSIPICQAANFSVGVNVLMDLVARASQALPHRFDIEIAETHHRWKLDAPSGTALALGEVAAAARGLDQNPPEKPRGAGARADNQIGYQVARGGDVAGDHRVRFLGDGEYLELGHCATDRAIFARGALHAARWLVGRPAGLYSMREVIQDSHSEAASPAGF